MLGLKRLGDEYIFRTVSSGESLALKLYSGERCVRSIPFDASEKIGDVWTLRLREELKGLSYTYENEQGEFSDIAANIFSGRERFGRAADGLKPLRALIGDEPEVQTEWEKDRPLCIAPEDNIIYRLHVRGFTMDRASGLSKEKRGSFAGIIEKIPYLSELGINAVELMPPYEFNEIMLRQFERAGIPAGERRDAEPSGVINYWGFTEDALYLAPKRSYTSGGNPKEEFRELVMALHKNGIELIVDFYFTEKTYPGYIGAVLRYWRREYHIDGAHLIGTAHISELPMDPYLAGLKLWAEHWDGGAPGRARLYSYNDGFQNDMRRALKGDEGMLRTLMYRLREESGDITDVHYLANEAGFTLMDLFSYERKHNEANGERNLDGTDYNLSWNCGCEGASRRRTVLGIRKRMIKNSLALLLLGRGTPLINSGDEMGRSKQGNNNSYCQDNRINWLDWRLCEKNKDILEFAAALIRFRREHGAFARREAADGDAYREQGIPDISFHGENAWRVDMESYRRELGVMYTGIGDENSSFMLLYNFHWEPHTFRLPHTPGEGCWRVILDTGDEDKEAFPKEGYNKPLTDGICRVTARSIVMLEAIPEMKCKSKGTGGRV